MGACFFYEMVKMWPSVSRQPASKIVPIDDARSTLADIDVVNSFYCIAPRGSAAFLEQSYRQALVVQDVLQVLRRLMRKRHGTLKKQVISVESLLCGFRNTFGVTRPDFIVFVGDGQVLLVALTLDPNRFPGVLDVLFVLFLGHAYLNKLFFTKYPTFNIHAFHWISLGFGIKFV